MAEVVGPIGAATATMTEILCDAWVSLGCKPARDGCVHRTITNCRFLFTVIATPCYSRCTGSDGRSQATQATDAET